MGRERPLQTLSGFCEQLVGTGTVEMLSTVYIRAREIIDSSYHLGEVNSHLA